MKKNIKLYNVFFPLWMILYLPSSWFIILPINFIFDSLVLYIAFKFYKEMDILNKYKKSIFKVFIFGFLSDAIGSFFMFFPVFLDKMLPNFLEVAVNSLFLNPFKNVYSFIWTILCVLISMFLIYILNLKFSFNKLDLTSINNKKISLFIAIATAPYIFLIPSELFIK